MFLDKKYILANELVQKMGINIANISILLKYYEDYDNFTALIKMNNCTFINTKQPDLPKNIKGGIAAHEFTDMSDKLPCTWVRQEFEVSERELFKSNIVTEKVTVSGKDLYLFDPDFIKKLKGKIPYILNREETAKCLQKGQIEGCVELSKNKFFTWYSV